MKRPYKTLLIILAAVAIDVLFYFCLLAGLVAGIQL